MKRVLCVDSSNRLIQTLILFSNGRSQRVSPKRCHSHTLHQKVQYHEAFAFAKYTDSAEEYIRTVDGVVTLGGDGTILHVSSLFDHSAVPPVISFSMGTVGFLLPFSKSVCILDRY